MSTKWVDPLDSTASTTATANKKPAGEPAAASGWTSLKPYNPREHDRDESVMYGLPSEASRPGCADGVDLAIERTRQTPA